MVSILKFLRTLFFLFFTVALSVVGTVYLLEKRISTDEKKEPLVENSAKNGTSFSFPEFLDNYKNSILYISASDSTEKNDFLESKHGTGFLFTYQKQTYILTNEHVASAPFLFADIGTSGSEFFVPLTLVGKSAEKDIALLRFEEKYPKDKFKPLSLGTSQNLRLGEGVYTIGYPLDIGFTASQGVLSGKNKTVDVESKSFSGLLQTDAAINPGNSGGPLVNETGKVIGVNVASTENAQGIGFSIPIDDVIPIIDTIIKKGPMKPGHLGVEVKEEDGKLIVSKVMENSAADKGGLKENDVLVSIEKKNIPTKNKLSEVLSMYEAGNTISVEISREGQTEVFPIVLDEKK